MIVAAARTWSALFFVLGVSKVAAKKGMIYASAKYDPGMRDVFGQQAANLKAHGGEPMSNARYVPNTGQVPQFDDGAPAPEILAEYLGASWSLEDGVVRHPVLLMEDLEVGYEGYIDYVVPHATALLEAFREKDWPVVWTTWNRRADDGLYGAVDRFVGPQGIATQENAMYMYDKAGAEFMPATKPRNDDEWSRSISSLHESKFADLDDQGNFILYPMLKKWGVDTVIIVGAWTEYCLFATAYDAMDKFGFDVVLVRDGIATATVLYQPTMKMAGEVLGKMVNTSGVLRTIRADEGFLEQAPYFRRRDDDGEENESNDAYLLPKCPAREESSSIFHYGNYPESDRFPQAVSLLAALGFSVLAAGSAATISALVVASHFQSRLRRIGFSRISEK